MSTLSIKVKMCLIGYFHTLNDMLADDLVNVYTFHSIFSFQSCPD